MSKLKEKFKFLTVKKKETINTWLEWFYTDNEYVNPRYLSELLVSDSAEMIEKYLNNKYDPIIRKYLSSLEKYNQLIDELNTGLDEETTDTIIESYFSDLEKYKRLLDEADIEFNDDITETTDELIDKLKDLWFPGYEDESNLIYVKLWIMIGNILSALPNTDFYEKASNVIMRDENYNLDYIEDLNHIW